MPEAGTELKQPTEITTTSLPKIERKYYTTWEEIRAAQLIAPYSQQFERYLERSKEWLSQPRISINPEEWNTLVDRQIQEAEAILTEFHDPQVSTERTNKLFVEGRKKPAIGTDVLTRVYIGVDPRHATDAFKTLLSTLAANDTLKDIDIALNMEELARKTLEGNMIILYEPTSRMDVLNRVFSAYKAARTITPEAFALSPRQRNHIMGQNFMQFKAPIDANMSFVEMAPEDRGRSYDSDVVTQIRSAFGLNPSTLIKSDELLQKMKEKEKTGVVWTEAIQQRMDHQQIRPGDEVHFKRRLSAPALI